MAFQLDRLTPMLETLDLDATRTFYCDTLGFTCENFSPDWGWMLLAYGNVRIMFSKPNEHRNGNAPHMSGSMYIQTPDVETIWTDLAGRAEICYPIENFDYGMREFAIFDNNGYIIQFGQPVEGN